MALYLTFLAYKTGGLAAVKRVRGAMSYYAKLQGEGGNYMRDPLSGTVVKGLERDFAKPVQQKEGFSPDEMRKIIKYFLREKICPKFVDLGMACLLLFLYLSAGRFEEAQGIELENIKTLELGNLMVQILKGKKNQLAKRQEVILPKMDASECKEMDITVLMKAYIEKLEDQERKSKYLFPSCRGQVKQANGREGSRLKSTFLLDKPISYAVARKNLLEAVKMTKIKPTNYGLHSCRIGALTAAANTGMFSQLQLQNLGRWAQMESAARYFLPREQEQVKVAKELGSRLASLLGDQVLKTAETRQAACNLEASKTKAAVTAVERKREKVARKRSKEVEKQGKAKERNGEKVKRARLLLRFKRAGTGAEDYQALPTQQ